MSKTRLETGSPPAGGAFGPAAAPAVAPGRVKHIRPARTRLRLRDVRLELPVVRVVAARDLKVKYKQSALGPLWLLFQPLALLGVLVVAFSGLADVGTGRVPYVVFALAGLSLWMFVQASVNMGTASIVSNYQLVRRTACPRLAFPLASLIASLPALAVPLVAALALAASTGHLSVRAVLIPIAVAWLLLFTAGVLAISSALAVRFRDLLSALPFLLQVGVFMAPVGYPLGQLPPTLHTVVSMNPLTGLIEAWRWTLLEGMTVDLLALAISVIWTGVLVVVGWWIFSRMEVTMADEI